MGETCCHGFTHFIMRNNKRHGGVGSTCSAHLCSYVPHIHMCCQDCNTVLTRLRQTLEFISCFMLNVFCIHGHTAASWVGHFALRLQAQSSSVVVTESLSKESNIIRTSAKNTNKLLTVLHTELLQYHISTASFL